MKLKITPFHLVCMILVQIILIDILLIFFLAGNAGFKRPVYAAGNAKAETKQNKQAVATPGKQAMAAPIKEAAVETFQEFLKRKGLVGKIGQTLLPGQIDLHKTKEKDFKLGGKAVKKQSFIATAYDLSYESCGKYPSNPEYGITFSGKKAVKGRTIAVDPEVIPLGSSVYVEFPKPYTYLNGWYVAEDTGSKVKGKIIDIFMGESAFKEMEKFGRRNVKITVVYP